ncbi:hypothetical protein [Rhizobium sp. R635]|uniref:hypothetical protein n=1 Tax=unclassified Rhizobium TaxID=2613769 RepID=UPI001AED0E42|nr:hypothetical protein [Rhizobium sp. R635]
MIALQREVSASAIQPRPQAAVACLHALHFSHFMYGDGRSASHCLQFDEINDDTNERHCHVIDFPFSAIEADAYICVGFRQLGAADERLGG